MRGGWADNEAGLRAYGSYLRELAQDEAAWSREGLVGLAQGWAIGTLAWRRALAKEHAARSLTSGLPRAERMELRQASWRVSLEANLATLRKLASELKTKPLKQPWKITLAERVRQESGASIAWLADQLKLGRSATLRGYFPKQNVPKTNKTRPDPVGRAALRLRRSITPRAERCTVSAIK